MRTIMLFLLMIVIPGRSLAAGAEIEAKQVAQASNCKPGKIEVMRQVPGGNGEIVYKIICTDYPQMFVLVLCHQRLCTLLR